MFLFFNNLNSPVKIESQESSVLINYTVAEEEIVNNNILYFENDFNGSKEFMAFKESSGSFKSINKFGFMGKYQFNLNTLKIYKLKNASNFLKNPELQERIFLIIEIPKKSGKTGFVGRPDSLNNLYILLH